MLDQQGHFGKQVSQRLYWNGCRIGWTLAASKSLGVLLLAAEAAVMAVLDASGHCDPPNRRLPLLLVGAREPGGAGLEIPASQN